MINVLQQVTDTMLTPALKSPLNVPMLVKLVMTQLHAKQEAAQMDIMQMAALWVAPHVHLNAELAWVVQLIV